MTTPAERKRQQRERQRQGVSVPLCTICSHRQLKGKKSRERLICSVCWKKTDEAKQQTLERVRQHRAKGEKRMGLPYNHNYNVTLSIGFSNADRTCTINPSTESSYSEDEWNSLSQVEQEEWLDSETRDWANNYIEFSWDKPTDPTTKEYVEVKWLEPADGTGSGPIDGRHNYPARYRFSDCWVDLTQHAGESATWVCMIGGQASFPFVDSQCPEWLGEYHAQITGKLSAAIAQQGRKDRFIPVDDQ